MGPFAGSIASHKDYLPHRPFSAKGSSHAGGHRRDATLHGRRGGAPTLRRDTATTDRWSRKPRDRLDTPSFPPNGFTVSWTLSSKCFSPFPHGTCPLSDSRTYSALDGVYHPIGAAISNNPTRWARTLVPPIQVYRRLRGSHPLRHAVPSRLRAPQGPVTSGQSSSPDHNSPASLGQAGDFRPGHSSHFARRYWGNPSWFLFLRLLICLSSAGSSRSIWGRKTCQPCSKLSGSSWLPYFPKHATLQQRININPLSQGAAFPVHVGTDSPWTPGTLDLRHCRGQSPHKNKHGPQPNVPQRGAAKAQCAFDNSMIHWILQFTTPCRALLRSSSTREPRDPPLEVVHF